MKDFRPLIAATAKKMTDFIAEKHLAANINDNFRSSIQLSALVSLGDVDMELRRLDQEIIRLEQKLKEQSRDLFFGTPLTEPSDEGKPIFFAVRLAELLCVEFFPDDKDGTIRARVEFLAIQAVSESVAPFKDRADKYRELVAGFVGDLPGLCKMVCSPYDSRWYALAKEDADVNIVLGVWDHIRMDIQKLEEENKRLKEDTRSDDSIRIDELRLMAQSRCEMCHGGDTPARRETSQFGECWYHYEHGCDAGSIYDRIEHLKTKTY